MSVSLPPWCWALTAAVLGVILIAKGFCAVWKLLARSFIAFLFLALLGKTGLIPGFVPGANPISALFLAILGAPGFALLLIAPWLFA